jgi:CheY-like chemotaxis protein
MTPAASARLVGIQRAVGRASGLVKQLMLLGRPATDDPILIDVGAFVNELAGTLRQLLPEAITVEFAVPTSPAVARIDQSRLEAALLNLVTNARDAMPQGGALQVRVENVETIPPQVRLEVTDDGIGMDSATLHEIFDPFFTTKGPGVGTGLGLATTYSSITDAGGTIDAFSSVGEGTTIRVQLPAVMETPAAPRRDDAAQPRLDDAHVSTILVVEDEAELLELTVDILRSRGHRVFAALGGHEALDVLADHTDIDLLLTDVVMPAMSGTELATRARERYPLLEVLFLSGYAEPEGGVIDPHRLLSKPIGERDLAAAVESVLASRQDPLS